MGRLTDVGIRALKPDPSRILLVNDGDRLYLRIYPTGRKAWIVRDTINGRQQIRTIGPYPQIGVREARRAVNPDTPEAKALIAGKETVEALAREYMENVVRPRYKQTRSVERFYGVDKDLLPIANKKVVDVTRADLAALVQRKARKVSTRRGGPVAANRFLSALRRLFRYAVVRGYLETSPAELLTREVAGGKEKPRERVLTDDEIRAVWSIQHRYGELLRFLLASSARIGEAQAAKWRDIRNDKWHIPDNKSNRPHWLAVSSVIRKLLTDLPAGKPDDRVFVNHASLTGVQAWLQRWCKEQKIDPAFVAHDLRRSAATRMHQIGVAPHVVERILNHSPGRLVATYNRHEYESERIGGQEKWAKSLSNIVRVSRSPQSAKKSSRKA